MWFIQNHWNRCLMGLLLVGSCSLKHSHTLEPAGPEKASSFKISNGDLSAVFVDNSAIPPMHGAGYNGLASLTHRLDDSILFVPRYAGFNLEHIFAGDSLVELFEPRRHPMILYKKNAAEVMLYQSPTPISGVESLTAFKLVPPHYIDVTFSCILHNKSFFRHGYAGLFWASYIHAPKDQKIYFISSDSLSGHESWISTYSEKHGVRSTHLHRKDQNELFFAHNFNASLASHFSTYRFEHPFYFGLNRGMVLAQLFDAKKIIRFSQSPTGGGGGNPAWDFQYIIPRPKTGKIYSFKARLIYKPYVSAEDIRSEYIKWKAG